MFISLIIDAQFIFQRFFGMVRASLGKNEHPDAVLFLFVFRILSMYSLVKPPRGTNVTGKINCFTNNSFVKRFSKFVFV